MSSLEHFDQFFVLATVGLGLFVAGGANLAFGTRGNRVALRAVLSLGVCGALSAALYFLTRAELAAHAAGLLAGCLLATALVGSAWAHRCLAALTAVARKPVVRWGGVAVAGLGVVLGSVLGFESRDLALVEKDTVELELTVGRPPNRPTDRARAATDRGTRVVLKEPEAPRDPSELLSPEEKVLRDTKLDSQVIRHGDPSDASNCHGWVFTGGKFLLGPDDVDLILKENAYAETHDPHPGDVAIYRQSGAVAHSAIVRYVSEDQPVLVESKWGVMGVFLHPAEKTPYGTDVTFYRSHRRGHLLVGLGGASPDPSVAPPALTTE